MKQHLRRLISLLVIACLLCVPASALSVEQAITLLDRYYIDDLPDEARQAQTLDELLTILGDPYTTYMNKEELEQFLTGINDTRVVGIGVSIQDHETGVLITSVLDDSPALEAGLISGDVIRSVNGTTVTTTDEARSLLAGEVDTPVTITVLKTDGSTVELNLIRREIVVPTTVQYRLSEDGNACVISCTSFGDETPGHLSEALQTYDSAVNGFILDLSANPGGTSTSGALAAGRFVGGQTMYYLRDGMDQYNYTYLLPGTEPLTQKGAIVLTGPYSASSSELFLGAIRDHAGGIAIGQRTLGKGVAQLLMDESRFPDLFDGDALKVTVYRFFSPAGATNDKIGVMPTLLMSLENTYNAALLLCGDAPKDPSTHLKLTLANQIYFIHLDTALSDPFRPAFVELLEALPPSARLRCDNGSGKYTDITPRALAQKLELSEYRERTFSDVESSRHARSINTLAVYRLLNGYSDGTFRPDALITRAEFCAMLANVLNLELTPVTQSRFVDVGTDEWYSPAVHALYEKGLLSGYDGGFFQPNNSISQQEAVSILSKLAPQLNMHAYDRRNHRLNEQQQAAFSHFSSWAQQPAWLLDSCGVDLSELTSPSDQTTRGLAAHLICQLLMETNVLWPDHQ